MLTTKDLPKLLGLLGKEYPIVFMELGSEKLHSRKTIQIIKQADKIMLGVSGHKKSLHEVSKLLNTFREKVKEVSCKIFIYENQIRILEKRKNLTDLQKKVYSKTEIEKKLSHPLDFFLDGPLQTIESYAGEQLLIHRENSGRAAVKMRSLGRWLVNKSRGLSLGGGGARAISEIGVLRAMEKKDIHFDAISGTSMGALIGALYAAGYNSYEIEKKFKEILPNDSVFTDYTLPFLSFFRGKKLDKLLKRVFGKLKFEDLSIPFYCVAADLLSGKEVVFDSGYLWLAIRASMSLPVIFPPVRYKNYYLIDGGALNNIPGSILKSQRVNKVIGVNCTPFEDDSIARYFKETNLFNLLKPKRGFLKNMFLFLKNIRNFIRRPPILQIANRSMMIEGAELTKSKAHIFDVLLHPDVKDFGLFDFQRREELIRCGEKAAENHLKGNKK